MKSSTLKILIISTVFLTLARISFAGVSILPRGMSGGGEDQTLINISPQDPVVHTDSVAFQASCYGTNNRGTRNPISPSAMITSVINVGGKKISFRYLGRLAGKSPSNNALNEQSIFISYLESSRRSFCNSSMNQALCRHTGSWQYNKNISKSKTSIQNKIKSRYSTSNIKSYTMLGELNSVYEVFVGDKRFIDWKKVGSAIKTGSALSTLERDIYVKINELAKDYCLPVNVGTRTKRTNAETTCLAQQLCTAACILNQSQSSCISACKNKLIVTNNMSAKLRCSMKMGGANHTTPNSAFKPVSCYGQAILADVQGLDPIGKNVSVTHYQNTGSSRKVSFYAYTGHIPDGKNKVSGIRVGGQSTLNIKSTFPGQDGYCGGYHSPLMIFFDEKLPLFTGTSDFIRKDSDGVLTHWPESNHYGYFLVRLDGNKKKVDSVNQLFGNNDDFTNGFDALEYYDDNRDGVIDKNDPVFEKLYLWKDQNGNGHSEKRELIKITDKGIYKFDILKMYDKSYYLDFNNRAKARGKSFFYYHKGRELKWGSILDIYFMEL